jgi:hypothetical protein
MNKRPKRLVRRVGNGGVSGLALTIALSVRTIRLRDKIRGIQWWPPRYAVKAMVKARAYVIPIAIGASLAANRRKYS